MDFTASDYPPSLAYRPLDCSAGGGGGGTPPGGVRFSLEQKLQCMERLKGVEAQLKETRVGGRRKSCIQHLSIDLPFTPIFLRQMTLLTLYLTSQLPVCYRVSFRVETNIRSSDPNKAISEYTGPSAAEERGGQRLLPRRPPAYPPPSRCPSSVCCLELLPS